MIIKYLSDWERFRPTPLQKKETLAGIDLAGVFCWGVHR